MKIKFYESNSCEPYDENGKKIDLSKCVELCADSISKFYKAIKQVSFSDSSEILDQDMRNLLKGCDKFQDAWKKVGIQSFQDCRKCFVFPCTVGLTQFTAMRDLWFKKISPFLAMLWNYSGSDDNCPSDMNLESLLSYKGPKTLENRLKDMFSMANNNLEKYASHFSDNAKMKSATGLLCNWLDDRI